MNYEAKGRERRLRGTILKLLKTNHEQRNSRYDSTLLASNLVRGLAFDVSPNEVMTTLEDLCGRGYLSYREVQDKKTHESWYMQITLTPRGRDLLEGNIPEDPAVES